MGHSVGAAASGSPRLVAIHHPLGGRARHLAAAVAAAGFDAALLPPIETDAKAWRDCGFDVLAFAAFHGDRTMAERLHLARGIAARRPLIILSDGDNRDERMAALDAGADDAVGWDDDPAEVVARIAGLVRRSRLAAGLLGGGELRIDLIDRRVERAGRLIPMPLREFDLLANLARVPGQPVSRTALLKAVWRIDFDPGTNRVEVHMSRLRGRIDRGFDWPMLHTVKGHGYALRLRHD